MTRERRTALVLPALGCAPVSLPVSNGGLLDRKISGRQQTSIKVAQDLPAHHGRARVKKHLYCFFHCLYVIR